MPPLLTWSRISCGLLSYFQRAHVLPGSRTGELGALLSTVSSGDRAVVATPELSEPISGFSAIARDCTPCMCRVWDQEAGTCHTALALVQVVVAAFQAPAPPTQVAFFFHSTEIINPCMWATDLDLQQTAYPAPNCRGCMVRSGPAQATVIHVSTLQPGIEQKVLYPARTATYAFRASRNGQAENQCTVGVTVHWMFQYPTLDAAGCKCVLLRPWHRIPCNVLGLVLGRCTAASCARSSRWWPTGCRGTRWMRWPPT